jgi:uncharacterized protein with HEPN domain
MNQPLDKNKSYIYDILIHSYENADLDEIWKTIKVVMPELISKLSVL